MAYGDSGFRYMPCLSEEEIRKVLEQVETYGFKQDHSRWQALMSLLINYGPRISEVLLLTWEQIDFARQTVTFPTLKRRKPHTRTLPLFPEVAALLLAHQANKNSDPRVFPTKSLKAGKGCVWRAFKTMLKRAGLPHYKVHALRHTAATRFAQIDLVLAKEILGHANIATTSVYLWAVRMREQFAQLKAIA